MIMTSRFERIYSIQDIEPPTRSELFAAREILHLLKKWEESDAHDLAYKMNISFDRLDEICLYLVEHSLL